MDSKNKKLNVDKWKAISFMIFRTGSILIVGNCDISILNIIYKYLKDVLINEYKSIHINIVDTKPKKIKQNKKKTRTITLIKNITEKSN